MANREKIAESLGRVTGQAKELLEIILKEIDEVATAFKTGDPPNARTPKPTSGEDD